MSPESWLRNGRAELPLAESPERNRFDRMEQRRPLLRGSQTRTSHDVKPAETAVDRDKRHDLLAVAREYLRHLPPSCHWRREVVSVYYEQHSSQPQIELFQNIFPMA
jgi:hypothetical protein